jgi:hypothetical protein
MRLRSGSSLCYKCGKYITSCESLKCNSISIKNISSSEKVLDKDFCGSFKFGVLIAIILVFLSRLCLTNIMSVRGIMLFPLI